MVHSSGRPGRSRAGRRCSVSRRRGSGPPRVGEPAPSARIWRHRIGTQPSSREGSSRRRAAARLMPTRSAPWLTERGSAESERSRPRVSVCETFDLATEASGMDVLCVYRTTVRNVDLIVKPRHPGSNNGGRGRRDGRAARKGRGRSAGPRDRLAGPGPSSRPPWLTSRRTVATPSPSCLSSLTIGIRRASTWTSGSRSARNPVQQPVSDVHRGFMTVPFLADADLGPSRSPGSSWGVSDVLRT